MNPTNTDRGEKATSSICLIREMLILLYALSLLFPILIGDFKVNPIYCQQGIIFFGQTFDRDHRGIFEVRSGYQKT